MSLVEPKGRPFVACPKCRGNVVWPTSLSAEDKKALAQAKRISALEGAQLAQSSFGLDVREAKALSFHITRERGRCHRCNSSIDGEVAICPKCNSANLDW